MSTLAHLAAAALVALAASCGGAPPSPPVSPAPSVSRAVGADWQDLAFLAGEWEGTGNGATGPSMGTFSLTPELGGKVLVRRSVNESRGGEHEDLMVIFHAPDGTIRASYFDSEGHTINYAGHATGGFVGAIFVSDEVPGAPRFRLTYMSRGADALEVSFEIAMPGSTDFKPYVSGTLKRR